MDKHERALKVWDALLTAEYLHVTAARVRQMDREGKMPPRVLNETALKPSGRLRNFYRYHADDVRAKFPQFAEA